MSFQNVLCPKRHLHSGLIYDQLIDVPLPHSFSFTTVFLTHFNLSCGFNLICYGFKSVITAPLFSVFAQGNDPSRVDNKDYI